MAKNPLLPGDYIDSVTQATILFALKPYENEDSSGVSNPNLKWKIHQAWEDAGEQLAHSHWQSHSSIAFEEEGSAFEISADADAEIDRLNTIIAGIVAYQIINPDTKIALHSILHKKGGEVTLVIENYAARALKELFPTMRLGNEDVIPPKKSPKETLSGLFGFLKKAL